LLNYFIVFMVDDRFFFQLKLSVIFHVSEIDNDRVLIHFFNNPFESFFEFNHISDFDLNKRKGKEFSNNLIKKQKLVVFL
jgi:hypothetical protein